MRGRRGFAHGHEPLIGEHRLDDFAGAATSRHDHLVRLLATQQAGASQVGEDRIAGDVTIKTAVFLRHVVVEPGVEREDGEGHEAVTLADLPIVDVVRRCDLHGTRAEFAVDVRVRDHRNAASGQRQRDFLADQASVSRVIGIHRHRDVSEHRLGSCRGDRQITASIRQWIADLPKDPSLLFVLHFEVGHGSAELRIPVDEPLAAIDQAIVVEAHKRFDHRIRQSRVHGEALTRPVT